MEQSESNAKYSYKRDKLGVALTTGQYYTAVQYTVQKPCQPCPAKARLMADFALLILINATYFCYNLIREGVLMSPSKQLFKWILQILILLGLR